MALLIPRRLLVGTLGLVALGACLFPAAPSTEQDTPFSHAVHVGEKQIECRICHLFSLEGRGPTIPGPQVCRVCHDKLDVGKPAERQIAAFYDADARYIRSRNPRLHDDIRFSHGNHADAQGLDCAECHGDMARRENLPALVGTKANCTECHENRGAPRECSDCHRSIDKDTAPNTHDLAWRRAHGDLVHARLGGSANRCELCHTRTGCDACHQEERPRNHTVYFRTRGHGVIAAIDRNRCATCHSSNYCDQCHQTTRPRNHTAGWGGAQQRHCVGCHLPVQNTGCITCHKTTRSHTPGTPLPANHNLAMNCRQCHGAGVALPHPDNGTSCITCHR